jgi:intracellular multiplication protein IcmF
MDQSLNALCDVLKKIILELKPQHNAISFVLLTGKTQQGKTALLRQSQYEHTAVHAERSADIYHNQNSVLLELSESWLNQSKSLLQYTLKQLNRCHRTVKITGIIFCIDIHDLFVAEPLQYHTNSKSHAQFFERFGLSLGYKVDTAIIFTKIDVIAGFCEFFQQDHPTELVKPLGFSLADINQAEQLIETYKKQFDHFIETLGQQVLNKIHPARSSLKRTLIREFPLQLASLRSAIQSLVHNISPQLFRLNALYFTSAEQGTVSLDRLNKKIQHEYALAVQDQFPQSTNYQAYFIDGALTAFHNQVKRLAPMATLWHKRSIMTLAGFVGLSIILIAHHYFSSASALDNASKELILYEALATQNDKKTSALYHLTIASKYLEHISSNTVSLPFIEQLKTKLQLSTEQHISTVFLPSILADIEKVISDNQLSLSERYQALKIYLMLGTPEHFSQAEVNHWFEQHWQKNTSPAELQNKLSLLNRILQQYKQSITLNQQIITDARNYLNALPPAFLYYSLAKQLFSHEKQVIHISGFLFANNELPVYLTKSGFKQVINHLDTTVKTLQENNWVLAHQDLDNLHSILEQAYCYEYVTWWQNALRHIRLEQTQNYTQARELVLLLRQSDAFTKLIDLLQEQTAPEPGPDSALFNQEIASKFTELSFISHSSIQNINSSLQELERFLATLSLVHDDGHTVFTLTKARFQGDQLSNPLSTLYAYAQQLPEPVSSWTKQIADNIWYSLISDTRTYINKQWQEIVLPNYQKEIAKRFPFEAAGTEDIALVDFDRFFAQNGILSQFVENYLKPFLDTSQPQWTLKESNNYVLPISSDVLNELIRANIITNMFFPEQSYSSKIEFSLQKVSLDPIVASLRLSIGDKTLTDTQDSDSFTHFSWPQPNATLVLNSIEGHHYELDEEGPWAFFKILQKVNVLVDEQDSTSLQILFEINGNSGRYLLKAQNEVNPFTPGILNGFVLPELIV